MPKVSVVMENQWIVLGVSFLKRENFKLFIG